MSTNQRVARVIGESLPARVAVSAATAVSAAWPQSATRSLLRPFDARAWGLVAIVAAITSMGYTAAASALPPYGWIVPALAALAGLVIVVSAPSPARGGRHAE